MKLFAFLIFLSIQLNFASKDTQPCENIEEKIAKVQNMVKRIKKNPNFCLISHKKWSRYTIQLQIPLGSMHYYGSHDDEVTGRQAVSMIVQKYLKSLERVQDGDSKSAATFHDLKLQYEAMFSTPRAQISKARNFLKQLEKKPNLGLVSRAGSHSVYPNIPPGRRHVYGTLHDKATAQQAVLMLASEYLKSLELVRHGRDESAATTQDLQQKYDEMFSKSRIDLMISKFENTLKKIRENPNFGISTTGSSRGASSKFRVRLNIPPPEEHWYGTQQKKATARDAVLMIAEEYLKSLKLVQNGSAESAATVHDLQRQYDETFGDKLSSGENKLGIAAEKENGKKNVLTNFKISQFYGGRPTSKCTRSAKLSSPESTDEEDETFSECSETTSKITLEIGDEKSSTEIATRNALENCDEELWQPSECDDKDNEFDIVFEEEYGKKNVLMTFQIFSGGKKEESQPIANNHKFLSQPLLLTNKNYSTKTSPKSTDEKNEAMSESPSEKADERPVNKLYKVTVMRLRVDEAENWQYNGWFTFMKRSEVFTVTKTKQVDDQIRGYCKECGGWVTLKWLDIGLEGAKELDETFKRKRDSGENPSETNDSEESEMDYYEKDSNSYQTIVDTSRMKRIKMLSAFLLSKK